MSYPYGTSLHVTVYIAPSNIDAFFAAFKPVFDKVTAIPECLFFEVVKSPEDPGKITWVEDWSKPPQWMIDNVTTQDYFKEYLAKTEPMFIKPREFQFFERRSKEYVYAPGYKA